VKIYLLKRHEGGPGQDGKTGVGMVRLPMFEKPFLEVERIWLYQQSLNKKQTLICKTRIIKIRNTCLSSNFHDANYFWKFCNDIFCSQTGPKIVE